MKLREILENEIVCVNPRNFELDVENRKDVYYIVSDNFLKVSDKFYVDYKKIYDNLDVELVEKSLDGCLVYSVSNDAILIKYI